MITNKALNHLQSIKKEFTECPYDLIYDPILDEILGVIENEVHVRSNYFLTNEENSDIFPCILIIKREEYLRVLNLWLDGKKEYCERYKYYCGVGGMINFSEMEELEGEFFVSDFDEEKEEMVDVPCKAFNVIKFQDRCEFEHG